MIEGLKFSMPAQELREHLAGRIEHHQERETWYRDKSEELVRGGVVAANMTGGDPVGALRSKEKQHANAVRLFTFMRDHVINDDYQLADADLQRLEILDRGW